MYDCSYYVIMACKTKPEEAYWTKFNSQFVGKMPRHFGSHPAGAWVDGWLWNLHNDRDSRQGASGYVIVSTDSQSFHTQLIVFMYQSGFAQVLIDDTII